MNDRDQREQAYEALLKDVAEGPGFQDPACVPDFSPHRPWVLVTVDEDSGHAWITLHHNPDEAGDALAEDTDVHGIRVDERESRLHDLATGKSREPTLVTHAVWDDPAPAPPAQEGGRGCAVEGP